MGVCDRTTGLKVEERTRLSVELHDTITQMLTGISLEIDAARDFAQSDPKEMNRHLDLAARTLSSCRNDLRNCMWDLRNQTLDDLTLDDAIRRTLAPHLFAITVMKTRILIADDHAVVRMGLAALFSAKKDFEVVGQSKNGEIAIRVYGVVPHRGPAFALSISKLDLQVTRRWDADVLDALNECNRRNAHAERVECLNLRRRLRKS